MQTGFCQFETVPHNPEANLKKIDGLLTGHRFDLMLLPELFTTGYAFKSKEQVAKYAEDLAFGETVRHLSMLAAQAAGYIGGTIIEKEGNHLFNTGILVGPQGLVGKQRKIHLPDYEKRFFEPGRTIQLIETPKFKTGFSICFDCWFPEISRILKRKGAQVILHPAAFGGPQSPELIRARSRENHVFTITANHTGTDDFEGEIEHYRGESRLLDPKGENIAIAGKEEKAVTEAIKISAADSNKNMISSNFEREWEKYLLNIKSDDRPLRSE
ncbi:MAG: carbon-nitrogen hydrolase family protein [Bacteroidales bacterium]|nr:carbon-nitrogen hydrolase family protein [Bacteroidales bacterium]